MSAISRRRGAIPRHADRAGQESPYRNRSVEENLDLFERMRNGEFPDGSRTLRAKIDMASANMNLRDPVMYRILHAEHHRTGNEMVHLSDVRLSRTASRIPSKASRTRSARWNSRTTGRSTTGSRTAGPSIIRSRYEFDRLNLTYTLLSKRKLLQLVRRRPCARLGRSAHADAFRHPPPRLYARGDPRNFCGAHRRLEDQRHHRTGLLEHHVREDLNKRAPRMMAVLRPLRVVIDNYPEGQVEEMEAVNNPGRPSAGTRKVPFSRVLYIEQDDFREDPPKQYYRLSPGKRSAAALRLFHHLHERREGTKRARWWRSTAPTIRQRAAATRPMAAR
jgi:glutaminyl-tRNA synthetase